MHIEDLKCNKGLNFELYLILINLVNLDRHMGLVAPVLDRQNERDLCIGVCVPTFLILQNT